MHTVGISIGSITGIDRGHLRRLRLPFVERVGACSVSGHLAWSSYDGDFLNDLLPLPFNEESLQVVSAHLREVEDALGRPFLDRKSVQLCGLSNLNHVRAGFSQRARVQDRLPASVRCQQRSSLAHTTWATTLASTLDRLLRGCDRRTAPWRLYARSRGEQSRVRVMDRHPRCASDRCRLGSIRLCAWPFRAETDVD